MKVLHERNPLVALVKQEAPHLSNGQALIAAMEIRDAHAVGIMELGSYAEGALSIFGDGTNPVSVRNAVTGFMVGLAAGGISSRANVFLATQKELYIRIREVTDPDGGPDANEVRKLLEDCVAMKTGGPAAE